jgi:hypothetical protein
LLLLISILRTWGHRVGGACCELDDISIGQDDNLRNGASGPSVPV